MKYTNFVSMILLIQYCCCIGSGKRDIFLQAITSSCLAKYTRSFTLLDIGSYDGYYGFHIANAYRDAVCILLEPSYHQRLTNMLVTTDILHNVAVLGRALPVSDINMLGQCEHFDVVLLMHGFGHYASHWMEFLRYVLRLGDNIFVRLNRHMRGIKPYLEKHGAREVAPQLYFVEGHKKNIQRGTWLFERKFLPYEIESTYALKRLGKVPFGRTEKVWSSWTPGINLITFRMCGGVYPLRSMINASIDRLKDLVHTDWRLRNMIVQGDDLVMIDFDDPRFTKRNPRANPVREKHYKHIMGWLDLDDPEALREYYFAHIWRKYVE